MKLYELPRDSLFKLNAIQDGTVLLSSKAVEKVYKLHHIDGMYSLCEDDEGHIHHFAAWTEVIPID